MENNRPGNSEFTAEFFDESSKEWMQNKIRNGQMTFYRCDHIHKNKKRCSAVATHRDLCKRHYILELRK